MLLLIIHNLDDEIIPPGTLCEANNLMVHKQVRPLQVQRALGRQAAATEGLPHTAQAVTAAGPSEGLLCPS